MEAGRSPSRESAEKFLRNCARRGDLADFTSRARNGQKPKLAAKTLSRLLVEAALDPSIAPKGIRLKGVRFEGDFDLGSSSGIDEFPALEVDDSDFGGFIDLSACRFCWLSFQRCTVAGGDRNGERIGILGTGIFVRIDLLISRSTIDGPVDFEDATTGRALSIERTRCVGTDTSIALSGAKIGAHLILSRLRLTGALAAAHLTVGTLVAVVRVMIRSPDAEQSLAEGLLLQGSRIGGDLILALVRIEGGFNGRRLAVDGYVSLVRLWVDGRAHDVGIQLAHMRCGMLAFEHARILGGASFYGIEVSSDLMLSNCTVDTLQWDQDVDEKYRLASAQEFSSLTIHSGRISGSIFIDNALLDGGLNLTATRIGNDLRIADTQMSSPQSSPSIAFDGAEIAGSMMLYGCSISSGVRGVAASVGRTLDIAGCDIGPFLHGPSYSSICLPGTKVRDIRLSYSVERPSGLTKSNRIHGTLWLARMTIQETIEIKSTSIRIDGVEKDIADHSAIILEGSRIGRHVDLADRLHSFSNEKSELSPPSIFGAVSLDDCAIEGDVYLVHTTIRARTAGPGDIADHGDSFDVRERKVGVALSMRGTRVSGTLRVSKPELDGIIDLRGASVGLLSDSIGSGWGERNRGRLRLDGFVYGGLDDGSIAADGDAMLASERRVSRRLRWLAMQYPDGKPSHSSFVPQPYEQLARTLGHEGNERERRAVVVAKRDAQKLVGGLSFLDRGLASALSFFSRYGYSPARSIAAVLILIALGIAGALRLDHYGALAFKDSGTGSPQPVSYAVDLALPVIDFARANDVRIIASQLPAPFQNQTLIELLVGTYQLLGVALVSIAILTLTGTLREKD